MDLYEDPANPANDILYVVNLNDKSLYPVTNLSGGGTVGRSLRTLLPRLGFLTAGSDIVQTWAIPGHAETSFELEDRIANQDGNTSPVLLRWRFITYSNCDI